MPFLSDVGELSQSEFKGIAEHCCQREHPGSSRVPRALMIAVMRCIRRLGLADKYPAIWVSIVDLCDAALATSWASLKKETGGSLKFRLHFELLASSMFWPSV